MPAITVKRRLLVLVFVLIVMTIGAAFWFERYRIEHSVVEGIAQEAAAKTVDYPSTSVTSLVSPGTISGRILVTYLTFIRGGFPVYELTPKT